MDETGWAGTTYGNTWMHRQLIAMLRCVDVRIVYAFAAIFVVPICLVVNSSRDIIYRYFRERHHYSRLKAAWRTFVNHCLFSQVVIDKFAMYAGKRFETKVIGYDHYVRLESGEAGFVQLSSHIGNYEIAGYTLVAKHKPINALVFGGEKPTVMAERNKILSKDNIRLIPLMPDMSHIFLINNALANNEIVSMPGDRMIGSKKSIEVTFLGAKAHLPMGPYQIAAVRGLDVIAVNVMKTSLTAYTIYVTPLQYNKSAEKRERITQLADAYTAELERVIRMYPTQWYNFYKFWN